MNIFGQPQLTDSRTLWVGDIESWMDEQFIASIFQKQGQVSVISVKLIKDKNTKMNAGYGFIEFPDHMIASHILSTFNGTKIPGTLK